MKNSDLLIMIDLVFFHCFLIFLFIHLFFYFPANISTSQQLCFNVDPKWKMKQNPTSNFQC